MLGRLRALQSAGRQERNPSAPPAIFFPRFPLPELRGRSRELIAERRKIPRVFLKFPRSRCLLDTGYFRHPVDSFPRETARAVYATAILALLKRLGIRYVDRRRRRRRRRRRVAADPRSNLPGISRGNSRRGPVRCARQRDRINILPLT